jgi:hypothetical protein
VRGPHLPFLRQEPDTRGQRARGRSIQVGFRCVPAGDAGGGEAEADKAGGGG